MVVVVVVVVVSSYISPVTVACVGLGPGDFKKNLPFFNKSRPPRIPYILKSYSGVFSFFLIDSQQKTRVRTTIYLFGGQIMGKSLPMPCLLEAIASFRDSSEHVLAYIPLT